MEEKNQVSYKKNVKHQKNIKPKKNSKLVRFLVTKLIVPLGLKGIKHTITEKNMDDIKQNNKNFLLLCNHNSFNDFIVVQGWLGNRDSYNVASIETFDFKEPLMRAGGAMPKRKYVNDVGLIRNLIYIKDKFNAVPVIYPEARYSHYGTNSSLPEALSKFCKLLKLPVVMFKTFGHHLNQPQWGDFKMRKMVPLHAEVTQILTAEEVEKLSVEEIDKKIKEIFVYDDYKYWQEAGFKINYKNRCVGIEKILYKCPNCKAEFKMMGYEDKVKCNNCNSQWELTETGFLNCLTGETKFKHLPDWCEWEREEVKKELKAGKYEFTDTMEAIGVPSTKHIVAIGKVNFKQNKDGFEIKGHYNKQNFKITKTTEECYTIQHDRRLPRFNKKDFIALSTDDDTIYMKPTDPAYIQKIYFATEEAHKLKKAK